MGHEESGAKDRGLQRFLGSGKGQGAGGGNSGGTVVCLFDLCLSVVCPRLE